MGWRYTKNGNLSKIQHCKDCGVRVEPIFIDGTRNADHWFFPVCQGDEVYLNDLGQCAIGCQEPVCDECSEEVTGAENTDLEGEGLRACNECLIETAMLEVLKEKSAQ
tara:strand:+ start:1309 stop:1632 length:324 start_codon:yes stop_codon:yes gene_type:complete